jgi:small subunit ribosomal protein S5
MSNSKYKNVELVKPSGELKDRLVSVNRVTKVTKVVELSVSAVVVGDENGVVGHGLENLKMFLKQLRAVEDAKKKFSKIPLVNQFLTNKR